MRSIRGVKEYCKFEGREIIVAWRSPYRYKCYENGKQIDMGFKTSPDGEETEAHAFCDKYSQGQRLQAVQ